MVGHHRLCQGLLGARILLCLIGVLSSCSMLFGSRVLILGSMSGVLICACQTTLASFQTSLTLLQDSFFIFQQAQGLSGHTSPYGECACSHLEATPGDWLPARLVFYFMTLAPRDCVTYCQARGLTVGVWPPRHGPHHRRWPGPQDQGVHALLGVHRKTLCSIK